MMLAARITREHMTTHIRIRQEGIFEVNLKGGGMGIPALDVRFPKQKGKRAEADKHNDGLKK